MFAGCQNPGTTSITNKDFCFFDNQINNLQFQTLTHPQKTVHSMGTIRISKKYLDLQVRVQGFKKKVKGTRI